MTTTAAGLLKSILEHPGEDSYRLVYADFLDDCGRGERGELIRLQCELDRFPKMPFHKHCYFAPSDRPTPKPRCPACRWRKRRKPLLKREAELLNALGYEIVNTPRRWPVSMTTGGTERIRIRRGFVESWAMTAADWLANADELLSAHPLREVRLTTIPVYGEDWDFVDSDMLIGYFKNRKPHRDHYADEQPQGLLIQEAMVIAEWPDIAFEFPSRAVEGLPGEEPPHEEAVP